MRFLVTGAAGFIGSNLIDRLLVDGHQVIGVDNLSTGVLANLSQAFRSNALWPGRFTFLHNDIQAPDFLGIVVGCNPDVVIHLAAHVDPQTSIEDPYFDARSNVLGTLNVCEASRRAGIRRMVYAGVHLPNHDTVAHGPDDVSRTLNPLSPYLVAKLAGEMYMRAYAEMYGLESICLALPSVYGPRQNPHGPGGVIARFGASILTGQPMTVDRNYFITDDFVYIDDVVEAFVRAAKVTVATTGSYVIGTGKHTAVTDVLAVMSAALDVLVQPDLASVRATETLCSAGVTAAGRELGWKPKFGLPEGIRRTVLWLRTTLEPEPEPTALIGA